MTSAHQDRGIVVLGAGLAGLAAAQRLSTLGIQPAVYEAERSIGGHAQSENIEGFWFDQGPHVSFTKDQTIRALFADTLNGLYEDKDAIVCNLWRGHQIPHPAQNNLYGLPVDVVTRCITDIVKARYESSPTIETYADWCYKALGKAFSEEFTFRYTQKYWTTTADNMTVDWVGQRVHTPSIDEVIRGALAPQQENYHYITRFRYPMRGGFAAYVQSVMGDYSINLNHRVVEIDPINKRILFSNGYERYYDVLISSLPLPVLIHCLKDAPLKVTNAADQLSCTSLVLCSIGVERQGGFPKAHWMYFYDDDIGFARAYFPHQLSPANVPFGCESIQTETYYSKYSPLRSNDVLDRTLSDLRRIGFLKPDDEIVIAEEWHIPFANILFDHNRATNLAIVEHYLDELSILRCGRYGEWDYLWSDDSIKSGWQVAERVSSRP